MNGSFIRDTVWALYTAPASVHASFLTFPKRGSDLVRLSSSHMESPWHRVGHQTSSDAVDPWCASELCWLVWHRCG